MQGIDTILATDCGSTTTKAILIKRQADGYRLVARGEAPTTVERPFEDVTVGVRNALRELEELTGRTLLSEAGPLTPASDAGTGVDLYLSTSSAGGGLQMMVGGVVKAISAESAQRAALGAGAIIMDGGVIAVDDGRKEYQRVEAIRQLRPDIILLSGGTDGGTLTHLTDLAETIRSADPRPRLGAGLHLPVIFAGNRDAAAPVGAILDGCVDLRVVENVRPALDRENLVPAREAIHELFLQHVMQQAPGYERLLEWTSRGVMSTPNAVGKMIEATAERYGVQVLAVDIGGATTDVFSVFERRAPGGGVEKPLIRTVSANLGMSYSVCNVLVEAGAANILRWLPVDLSEEELRTRLRNKMIRPTTIPQTLEDLYVEQAVAREALRLAFEHHRALARDLVGVATEGGFDAMLSPGKGRQSIVDLMRLDMIVGSGGVLSHAPERAQAASMLLDAFQPEGVTTLAVDSIFMMPQLGLLSTVLPDAAAEVFARDCLIVLGSSVCPVGVPRKGETVCTVRLADGTEVPAMAGELVRIPLAPGERVEAEIVPGRRFDVGAGRGKPVRTHLEGGVVGAIIDARGRPPALPAEAAERVRCQQAWRAALEAIGNKEAVP